MSTRKITAVMLVLALILISASFPSFAEDDIVPVKDYVNVERIDFKNPGFIRGMDISSVISLENAGAVFRNEKGEEEDIFRIVSECGVNCIRVRVWNDPYDKNGMGYGGGNNDLEKAKIIGKRAAEYGMKLLVDLHYSDFWADPSKQKEPKAWSGLDTDDKKEKIYEYTTAVLGEISDAGADIEMVQIGNEITSGICGVTDNRDRASLLISASKAVRDFDRNIYIACHFTDPQKTDTVKWYADYLYQYNVDYDVFALSYYPSWHGSLSNLTDVLNYAADKYGKYAMVAETSYPYTLSDTDGHPNTVSEYSGSTGDDMQWDFSVQGQADEVRSVMNAVNNVNNGYGLGVFYWEGAWITVGDITGLTGDEYRARYDGNRLLWEKYGCGWASSYCAEYDPDDAGVYYGGSAVDNQAFFDSKGRVLSSLHVFKNVLTGSCVIDTVTGDVDSDGAVSVNDVTMICRYLADMIYFSDLEKAKADTDDDGSISSADITFLQRQIADL